MPLREIPAKSAKDLRATDAESAREREPFEFPELDVTTTVAAQALTDQQDHSVDREEDRRGEWLREEDAQFVLQQDAGNPDRHRGDGEHEQQSVVRIGVGFVEVPERRDTGIRNTRQLSAETAKERDPRLAIKHEESEGRAHVQSDDEARKNDSDADWEFTRLCQPRSPGSKTLWPRLETGKSSVKPCVSPMMMAWKYDRDACTLQR